LALKFPHLEFTCERACSAVCVDPHTHIKMPLNTVHGHCIGQYSEVMCRI